MSSLLLAGMLVAVVVLPWNPHPTGRGDGRLPSKGNVIGHRRLRTFTVWKRGACVDHITTGGCDVIRHALDKEFFANYVRDVQLLRHMRKL